MTLLADETSELREAEGDRTRSFSDGETDKLRSLEPAFVVEKLKSKLGGREKPAVPVGRDDCQLLCSDEQGEAGADVPAFSRSARRHACEQ